MMSLVAMERNLVLHRILDSVMNSYYYRGVYGILYLEQIDDMQRVIKSELKFSGEIAD